jgi:acyl dehydratase
LPLNRACIGRRYPPTRVFEVGRDHIRRFAEAIGDANPAYVDPDHARSLGHRDVVAPPTYLMSVVGMAGGREAMADPDLGLDRRRVVHAEQRFTAHRPVHPGDRLVLTATIEDIYDRGDNEVLSLRHDIDTEAGEAVCSAWFVITSRGTAGTPA